MIYDMAFTWFLHGFYHILPHEWVRHRPAAHGSAVFPPPVAGLTGLTGLTSRDLIRSRITGDGRWLTGDE